MVTTLLALLLAALLAALFFQQGKNSRREQLRSRLSEVSEAKQRGSHRARLQFPNIDLSRCFGCGLCVKACPEEGVLDLIHGQAVVVHGSRCVGHGLCASACPVDAITVTLGDLSSRRDIPALSPEWEAHQAPGVFLAGEVTGYALVKTAISHGTAVADAVHQRLTEQPALRPALDLCIVGSGPAGLACSLRAKELGLDFVTLEQELSFGGTVAKYPRSKLVMTQPVSLPLHGTLKERSYAKEELIDIWEQALVTHELPLRLGETYVGLERDGDALVVRTANNTYPAKHVCLALGRRGSPRKLGVPGEELPKVLYSVEDARSYQGRKILVVGGGDSAIEAAIGLAQQPGNSVTLSYRKHAFFRLKAKNERLLGEMREAGAIQVLFSSEVEEIGEQAVRINIKGDEDPRTVMLANDDVIIMAGGIPPFPLLEQAGVSFDPAHRPNAAPLRQQGTGLRLALLISLGLALILTGWRIYFRDYYGLPQELRFDSPQHELLRSSGTLGLAAGVAGTALISINLCYLLRRSQLGERLPGSLRAWMTSHVVTGILALLLIVLHGAMQPHNSIGGHAFWSLAILIFTGAIGRYFYAFVPHAANGKELALDEARERFTKVSTEWDTRTRGFGAQVRKEVEQLVERRRWEGKFITRVKSLIRSQREFARFLQDLERRAESEGLHPDQISILTDLSRRAHRSALMVTHYEDLRSLLGTWRFVHRWFGLLMVLLAAWHIVIALQYSPVFD